MVASDALKLWISPHGVRIALVPGEEGTDASTAGALNSTTAPSRSQNSRTKARCDTLASGASANVRQDSLRCRRIVETLDDHAERVPHYSPPAGISIAVQCTATFSIAQRMLEEQDIHN